MLIKLSADTIFGVFLHRYIKGARSERELLGKFYELGYSVLRSAGSGVSSLGPDIIAIKDGVCLSFECKAWDRGSLSLDPESFDKIYVWEKNTSSHTYVAWKIKNRGWLFVRPDEFTRAEKNYNVTLRRAQEINRTMDNVLARAAESMKKPAVQAVPAEPTLAVK